VLLDVVPLLLNAVVEEVRAGMLAAKLVDAAVLLTWNVVGVGVVAAVGSRERPR
jgi:hypothetical protein